MSQDGIARVMNAPELQKPVHLTAPEFIAGGIAPPRSGAERCNRLSVSIRIGVNHVRIHKWFHNGSE